MTSFLHPFGKRSCSCFGERGGGGVPGMMITNAALGSFLKAPTFLASSTSTPSLKRSLTPVQINLLLAFGPFATDSLSILISTQGVRLHHHTVEHRLQDQTRKWPCARDTTNPSETTKFSGQETPSKNDRPVHGMASTWKAFRGDSDTQSSRATGFPPKKRSIPVDFARAQAFALLLSRPSKTLAR
jgi:hypothetical protein